MPMFGRRVLRELTHLRAIEVDDDTDISHHGIKGQKWGVRRHQNPDGSLTQEGYEHYARKNSGFCNGSNGTQLERIEK